MRETLLLVWIPKRKSYWVLFIVMDRSIHKQPFKRMIMISLALQQAVLFLMGFMTSNETQDISRLERVMIPVNLPVIAYFNGG
ncbi:hypothetical protein BMR09_06780 [Methylococcaceae bacterium CS3]|nr:hypothetical protein BMR09_06780 [Methylococcaceae bacterium CS3]